MKWILALTFMLFASSATLSAGIASGGSGSATTTWKKFDEEVTNKVAEIKWLAFGPIMRIVGMLALAYALISVFITNSYRQLLMFSGFGLVLTILPSFIDTIFSALLPKM